MTILCKSKFDCVNNAECIEGQCFCQDGFKAQGSVCADIDECAAEPCGSSAICTNTPGGFRCNCLAGYIGAPPTITCKGTLFMNSILINQLLTLFKLLMRFYILNTFSLCKLRLKHLKKTFKLLRNYLLPT